MIVAVIALIIVVTLIIVLALTSSAAAADRHMDKLIEDQETIKNDIESE